MPAYVLELPETVSDVLIAETDAAALHRFSRTVSGIAKLDQRYMSIGLNGVGKKRAWDKKTPLGIYFITDRLDTSNLDDKYGVAAYPLDYPNAWDRYRNRTGDGIWLHGMDRNGSKRPPRDTDGCLALPNEELLALGETLKPLVTPVIVARELTWSTPEELERIRVEFRIALEMWRQSLEASDQLTYLSLYADDFRHREMDKEAWASSRLAVLDARDFESVDLGNVLLIADPEEAGLYLSRFTQEFVTDAGTVRITKRLYWRRQDDNFWQIVAEDSG
ncbi:MAG: murein L,D-transpeptidase family protein [Woeseiaceae bacterium]